MVKPVRPDFEYEIEASPERLHKRESKPEVPDNLMRPPGFERGA